METDPKVKVLQLTAGSSFDADSEIDRYQFEAHRLEFTGRGITVKFQQKLCNDDAVMAIILVSECFLCVVKERRRKLTDGNIRCPFGEMEVGVAFAFGNEPGIRRLRFRGAVESKVVFFSV